MEKAELLRDADANLLPALLRLQELVRKCNKLFVYVSTEPLLLFLHCVDDEEGLEELFVFVMNDLNFCVAHKTSSYWIRSDWISCSAGMYPSNFSSLDYDSRVPRFKVFAISSTSGIESTCTKPLLYDICSCVLFRLRTMLPSSCSVKSSGTSSDQTLAVSSPFCSISPTTAKV